MKDKYLKVYQFLTFLIALDLVIIVTTLALHLFSITDVDPIYAITALLSVPVLVVIMLGVAVTDLIFTRAKH